MPVIDTICPFCDQDELATGATGIENELCLFTAWPTEVLPGSGLIIPRAHRSTVFDLTPEEWQATYELLQRVKVQLDETIRPNGYNIGWNCGTVGGQEVFHTHLHVIPRFADEPLAGRGIRYWLKQESNRRP